jgi:hypothetical protein
MWGTPAVSDHVRARREIRQGWFGTVDEGRRGIVGAGQPGFWTTRCTVEFDDGWTTVTVDGVSASDLTRTFGHGEQTWQRRRDLRAGVRLGLWLTNVPLFIGLALYFLHGGTVAGLVVGLIDATLGLALAHPLLVVAAVGGLFALRRLRSSR